MDEPTCSVDDCDRGGKLTRGWCRKHYMRWWTNGDPLVAKTFFGSSEERFWHYVDKRGDDECWPWTGTITVQGYGEILDGKKNARAHIVGYRLAGMIVPSGLVLDHTCHDPAVCTPGPTCPHRRCCNLAHLEPVTNRVNSLRGGSPVADNARKTKCLRGHSYNEINTAWRLRTRANGTTYWARYCRPCAREQDRQHKAARRAVAA